MTFLQTVAAMLLGLVILIWLAVFVLLQMGV